MNHLRTFLLIVFSTIALVRVDAIEPDTYIFDIEENDTLRLDVYRPAETDSLSPALIFAFGGSFKHGTRDDARYIPFFKFLSDNGVTVISTDYRTLLKYATADKMTSAKGFTEALTGAVQAAVTDYLKATAFTVAHSQEWGIDVSKIFACGSSAGAITVLQAESEICNTPVPFPFLPENFNYAGVITFAGAVMAEGEPTWIRTPAPMLLFQGDADSTVPFDRAVIGSYGLYGSKTISETLSKSNLPNRLHRFNGAGHEIAIEPMTQDCGEVLDFIRSVCAGKENKIISTVETVPGQTEYKTDFSIGDYLRANM